MTRRILSYGALLSLLVSTPAFARFFDVEVDHPYGAAIEWATREGIVEGYGDRSFQPQRGVNRAEFTRMIASVFYRDEIIEACLEQNADFMTFPDVPEDAWFAPYICIAQRNGLVSGFPDGLFHPEEGVNFVEAAKMLSIGFELTEIELPNVGEASAYWYEPYVLLLSREKAIPPSIAGMGHFLTRGEVMEMFYRLSDQEPTDGSAPPAPSLTPNQVKYPVDWEQYRDMDYRFAFYHPTPWKEPDTLSRGSVADGIPHIQSDWTVYTGPASKICQGYGTCIERDLQIQGYDLQLLESILDEIETSEQIYEISFQGEINKMPVVVFLEQGRCAHWRALYKGRYWLYLVTAKCGGEDENLEQEFNRFIQGFSQI